MSTSRRVILVGILGFVGLLVVGAAAVLFMADLNDYKARLESAASQALGVEVSVDGRLRVASFPGVLVTLEDVHIRNRGAEVASARQVRLAIDLLPLLKKEVRVEKIELSFPRISIERDRRGQFNFEKPDAASGTLPALDWPNVSLTDGTFVYADQQSGDTVNAADCRLDLHRLRVSAGTRANLFAVPRRGILQDHVAEEGRDGPDGLLREPVDARDVREGDATDPERPGLAAGQEAGTSSEIHTLVSDWKVERGVAQAQDVAMATKANRIALQGMLDFVNKRFDDVTVALIDAKGCAKVQQKIRGTFQNPMADKPSLLTSLTGPALNLLRKGRDLLLGGRCDVFYAGSVVVPR